MNRSKKLSGICATAAACLTLFGLAITTQSVQAQSSLLARDPATIKYGWQNGNYVKKADLEGLKQTLSALPASFMKDKAMCTLDVANDAYRHARTTGVTEYFAAQAHRYGQIAANEGANVFSTPVAPGTTRGFEDKRAELLRELGKYDPECPPPELACADLMLSGAEFEMGAPTSNSHAKDYLKAFDALIEKSKTSGASCRTPKEKKEPVKAYTISADALFKFNKSGINDMTADGKTMLDDLAAKVKSDFTSVNTMTVIGHTDRLGSDAYNQKLSQARAQTGANYLRQFINAHNVEAIGKGKTEPVTGDACVGNKKTQALIDCLQPDRRIEVRVDGVVVNGKDLAAPKSE